MLKCYELKCEGLKNPMGIDISSPRFSWKLESDRENTVQSEYEIIIDGAWKKREKSDNSLFVEYDGEPLKPKTKYTYKVRAWDNNGEVSDFAEGFFATGLMGEAPEAKWIGAKEIKENAPMLVKKFVCENPETAYIFASAYGLYEIYLNGEKVGDRYLTPGYTAYNSRIQYQMYDVENMLKSGENEIKILLGKGWCCGGFPFRTETGGLYGKLPSAMLQLEINGKIAVKTDETWKKYDSQILFSEIYNGETYDSTLENKYINEEAVRISDYGYDNLVWNSGESVKLVERVAAKEIIKTPKGETVIDFGQNLAGWVEINASGKTGDKIKYIHGEILDKDGNFYFENMRDAKNTIEFTLNGEKNRVLRPHFSFQGFRYIRIEECDFEIKPECFTACVLCSVDITGSFESKNPLLNRFFKNVLWGQRGNFIDIPTDCPQRNERMGWTGDAQVFISTAAKNADVYAFFRKWLYDMKAEQRENGNVQFFIPAPQDLDKCSSAWGDAATICPWTLYKACGDKKLLSELYPMMKKWVYCIKETGDNEFLWDTGFHFGDWLSLDAEGDSCEGGTDKFYIATAFYAYSTSLVIKAAKELDLYDDVKEFEALYENIVKEFKKTFLDEKELPICQTHTAYILLLNMGLTNNEKEAASRLNQMIIDCGTRLNTGFVGTPYLCFVLSKYGYTKTAYSLLLRTEYPSWLYPVTKGATTIWERWDGIRPDGTVQNAGMNSYNHYAYGCVADWIYSVVCGISEEETSKAYKKSVIKPMPDERLGECYAEFETPYGKIGSGWKYENDRITFRFLIPCNTTSKVILPNGESHILGSGSYFLSISK